MKLTLGPLLYYWPRQATLDFYAAIAKAPVDVVYLGETVCARRHELRAADWLEVAEALAGAGKEVVLSTQVLVESGSDLKAQQRLLAQDRFLVEANDMGAVRLLHAGRSWVAGATLNVFNHATLGLLLARGARRWVLPPEMSREQLAAILARLEARPEVELQAYGRLPLAISARQPFLPLNGVQTQSARVYNLLAELPDLAAAGVTHVRVSPQGAHTLEVIDLFRQALDDRLSPANAYAASQPLMPEAACNGFWHGRPGLEQYVTA